MLDRKSNLNHGVLENQGVSHALYHCRGQPNRTAGLLSPSLIARLGLAFAVVLLGTSGWTSPPGRLPLESTANSDGYFQVPAAPKKPPVAAPADAAPVAGPDAEHQAMLLKDIEHALSLLKDDKVEQFIEDYYPIDMARKLRQLNRVTNAASDLRRTKSVLKRFESKLTKCQAGTIEGTNHEVLFMPATEPAAAEVPATPAAPVKPVEPDLKGYGGDVTKALQLAIADLKAKKYDAFIQQMLPVSEVVRLNEYELVAETALVFEQNPALAAAMIADLEALAKLPLKAVGDTVTATLVGRDKNETKREVRFQKVGGSWRFYDQVTETRTQIEQLSARAEKMQSNPAAFEPILKFERIREHWRLVELP